MEISPSLPCTDEQNHPAFLCSLFFKISSKISGERKHSGNTHFQWDYVFVCGFSKLNFDSVKEGLGCENTISHDSVLLIYRGTNDL